MNGKLYSVLGLMLFVCLWSAAGFFTVSSQTSNTLNEGFEAGGNIGVVYLNGEKLAFQNQDGVAWNYQNPITGSQRGLGVAEPDPFGANAPLSAPTEGSVPFSHWVGCGQAETMT